MVRPHTVRQHPRRTATGVTVVGTHNRAMGQVSPEFRQRLRAILDSGYNHGATRPIDWSVSGKASLDVLKKKIESRMGMANKGIRNPTLRVTGEEALSVAYRLILAEEERLGRAAHEVGAMTEGNRIVRVNGRTRRFWDARKADDWAAEQLRGLPPGTRAEIARDHIGKPGDWVYSALEVNPHGHVVRAGVPPLPPP